MGQILKRLVLSVALLVAAAAVLLLSDLRSRQGWRATPSAGPPKISVAILKQASNLLLDATEQGVLTKLAAEGFSDGGRLALQRFCAEGDLPTANTIATRLTDGSFKLVITISTLSMQCVANANREGRAIHVFGAVTDPAGAGVGIAAMGSTNKPPWLAGIGTFQPVEQIFREARKLWPDLKVVGVVWNPVERNSEACTIKAREICATLGIQLIEASVEQTKDVREAADSLIARGAQAFWSGADVTVLNASAALCDAALKARIPVFSNFAGQVREGSLFDLGADYDQVGQKMGSIAAAILNGVKPADLLITNYMPERVLLNRQTLERMRDPWRFTDHIVARAELILGKDGKVEKEAHPAPAAVPAPASAFQGARRFQIGLAYFGPDEGTDSAIKGLLDGLSKAGLVEGRNLTVRRVHANAEISAIPAMLQSLDGSDVDVIVPFSTPVLTAACATVRKKPVVFTYCSDPIAAGAGKTFDDHLPFVTGIGSFPPVAEAVEMLRLTFPAFKRLGTLYNNAEANSVKVVSVLRDCCRKQGIELIEVTANNTGEVVPAAQALAARQVEAVYLPGDNTAYQAFDGIVDKLGPARIPLIIDAPEFSERGALAVVGIGYYQSGYAAADPLARVLAGENPGRIPLKDVADKKVILNPQVAAKLGVTFPPAALAMQTSPAAPQAAPSPAARPLGKTWRIQQISYSESIMVEDAMRGLHDGLKELGLAEGSDYTLRTLSAQGDMATLGSLFDSARTAGADLYVVYSTPTLQIALKKAGTTPVVFTVVADPFVIGAGKSDQEHLPNITGVYTVGPYREMAELLGTHFPQIQRVGTLFCPAEANSVANKDLFVLEANRRGITVEAVPVNAPGELPDAALALCGRPIQAVMQVIDNLTTAGFPSIARAAAQARKPVLTCQGPAMKQGAVLALARDYYEAGRDTAAKAVRVMRGESPAQIPFSPPKAVKRLVNLEKAREYHWAIPEALLREMQVVNEVKP